MRVPVEVVRRIRETVGEDFIIIYRLSMLESIRGQASAVEQRELLDGAIVTTLDGALQLVAQKFPPSSDLPSTESGADASEDSEARATAAYAYLVAGTHALRTAQREQAQALFKRSQQLGPRTAAL
jgi:2,4-dienoyl-CoA reductase-like NADH-dependent reductase (Old Yellow Enzyme family)